MLERNNKNNQNPPGPELLKALTGDFFLPSPHLGEALQMLSKASELSADYDLHDLKPAEMAELASRLYDLGMITLSEYALVSFQPQLVPEYKSLGHTYTLMYANPTCSRNYIRCWKIHMQVILTESPSAFEVETTRKIIEILESLKPQS